MSRASPAAAAAVGDDDNEFIILSPAHSAAITQQAWKASFDRVIASPNEHGIQAKEARVLGVSPQLYAYHFKRYQNGDVNGKLPNPSPGAPRNCRRQRKQRSWTGSASWSAARCPRSLSWSG